MDIRNLLKLETVRQKLLVGTLFLASVPVVLTSLLVGGESIRSGRESLQAQASDALVSQRTMKAAQIQDYFDSLSNQVKLLAQSPVAVEAMRGLPEATRELGATATDTAEQRKQLLKYYDGDFLREYFSRNTAKSIDMQSIGRNLPDLAVRMQYLYIFANNNPLGKKNDLIQANDGSRYSELHAQLHPFMRTALEKFGLYDIFMVDPTNGQIVYTQFKELDFGTSLVDGPYAQTRLGDAYRAALALDEPGKVVMSEFGEYLPSYNDQAAFIATPIFDGARRIGILMVQIPLDRINAIMTNDGRWREIGLGQSGETYLVAADGTPRSISRFAMENMDALAKTFRRIGVSHEAVNRMQAKHSTIGLLPINTLASREALESGKTGFASYTSYRGQNVLGAYAPLPILGLKWAIVAEISSEEALQPVAALRKKMLWWSIGIAVVLLAVGLAIALKLQSTVTKPLARIQDTVLQVSSGDYGARTGLATPDEFGALAGAFDTLLDDRVARLAEAERENDELNDSVVNLLQAVAQLSRKDLTATAPVSNNVIGTVADSINLLTTETGKVLHQVTGIATQVRHATDRVKRQADSVSATAAAERSDVTKAAENIMHANKVMSQVAELAAQSNRAAERATETTQKALETVTETVTGMQGIRETIAEAEKRIKRLGERSQEISGIVNLINSIAERTHVLALNASMQAAVAGEAGRGFAVVAEEVQRLAESSRQATQQIGQLVSNIQIETADTINTVNRTISQVVSGSELALKSGDQMRETQQTTASLVELVQRIAGSAELQLKITGELRQRVSQIGASTEKTAAEILLQSSATEQLAESAERLVQSVAVFKLPESQLQRAAA